MGKDGNTVFVLGAGASCPCGYPSGARLRELICLDLGFMQYHRKYAATQATKPVAEFTLKGFVDTFKKSHLKSIDLFMSKNPKLASLGKYILAFEIFRAEKASLFAEEAKNRQCERERIRSADILERRIHVQGTADFLGGDWYSCLYGRLMERSVGQDNPSSFLTDDMVFITFNYDRSLEHFFYESLRHSYSDCGEEDIVRAAKQLKVLHVYGQVAPLTWQDKQEGIGYKPDRLDEPTLQRAAANLKTIYEQKASSRHEEAKDLLAKAKRIFFLGFGYAPENMDILGLPGAIAPDCEVYGTGYGLIPEERDRIRAFIERGRRDPLEETLIESGDVDCLMLLRKYL